MAETILAVDDDVDILELIQMSLTAEGFDVITANDGMSGLEKARAYSPDLILLDLMMPVKTGLEASLEILDIDKSVPVVFSSGFNESEALDQLPPKTRSAFLKKPYLSWT